MINEARHLPEKKKTHTHTHFVRENQWGPHTHTRTRAHTHTHTHTHTPCEQAPPIPRTHTHTHTRHAVPQECIFSDPIHAKKGGVSMCTMRAGVTLQRSQGYAECWSVSTKCKCASIGYESDTCAFIQLPCAARYFSWCTLFSAVIYKAFPASYPCTHTHTHIYMQTDTETKRREAWCGRGLAVETSLNTAKHRFSRTPLQARQTKNVRLGAFRKRKIDTARSTQRTPRAFKRLAGCICLVRPQNNKNIARRGTFWKQLGHGSVCCYTRPLATSLAARNGSPTQVGTWPK